VVDLRRRLATARAGVSVALEDPRSEQPPIMAVPALPSVRPVAVPAALAVHRAWPAMRATRISGARRQRPPRGHRRPPAGGRGVKISGRSCRVTPCRSRARLNCQEATQTRPENLPAQQDETQGVIFQGAGEIRGAPASAVPRRCHQFCHHHSECVTTWCRGGESTRRRGRSRGFPLEVEKR